MKWWAIAISVAVGPSFSTFAGHPLMVAIRLVDLPSPVAGPAYSKAIARVVTIAVPVPAAAALHDLGRAIVVGADTVELRPLALWPNGAVRWLGIDAELTLAPGAVSNLLLTNGTADLPTPALGAVDTQGVLVVDTGALRLVARVGEDRITVERGRPLVVVVDGESLRWSKVKVVECGGLRTVIGLWSESKTGSAPGELRGRLELRRHSAVVHLVLNRDLTGPFAFLADGLESSRAVSPRIAIDLASRQRDRDAAIIRVELEAADPWEQWALVDLLERIERGEIDPPDLTPWPTAPISPSLHGATFTFTPFAAAPSVTGTMTTLSQRGGWSVTLTPDRDPVPLNQLFSLAMTIEPELQAATADLEVRVNADMPAHRHGMNTRPEVVWLGRGRYRVDGMLFHMPGPWDIEVEIAVGDLREQARFAVTVD